MNSQVMGNPDTYPFHIPVCNEIHAWTIQGTPAQMQVHRFNFSMHHKHNKGYIYTYTYTYQYTHTYIHTHTHTHTHIYIYIYIYICVCKGTRMFLLKHEQKCIPFISYWEKGAHLCFCSCITLHIIKRHFIFSITYFLRWDSNIVLIYITT